MLPQLIALPFTFAIVSLLFVQFAGSRFYTLMRRRCSGIIMGSSSVVIFGEFVWSPNEVRTFLFEGVIRLADRLPPQIMARFLQDSPSAGTRAGVFFISAAFILCVYLPLFYRLLQADVAI